MSTTTTTYSAKRIFDPNPNNDVKFGTITTLDKEGNPTGKAVFFGRFLWKGYSIGTNNRFNAGFSKKSTKQF